MRPPAPLPLQFSWPLTERAARIDRWKGDAGTIGGRWSFDLLSGEMMWERGIYELFGFPADARITRRSAADCYVGESRAAMEQLRTHAIMHCRGFTLDVEIAPASGGPHHWMRLAAAPICSAKRAVRLEGVKHLLPLRCSTWG